MIKLITGLVLSVLCLTAQAQSLKGTVYEKSSKGQQVPLAGVSVYWSGTTLGTSTDSSGQFQLAKPDMLPARLVISYIGYNTDTISVDAEMNEISVELLSSILLKEVTVEQKKQSMSYSTLNPLNSQMIGANELKKSACCNLAESFETNATVDVTFTDAVSGTKQIRMLGLDGIYSQLLTENMPSIRGLSTLYGLAYIPGTWVEGISVTKGTGSVVNGYESIAGQINIELLKPEAADKLFVNLYAGDAGRFELNLHQTSKFGKHWDAMIFMHGANIAKRNDFNKDGFLDMPLSQTYNVFNRWKYELPGKVMVQFGVKALMDDRKGGQVAFRNREDNSARKIYGVNVSSRQLEVFSKTAIGFKDKLYRSLALQGNARYYDQRSYYGLKTYEGNQQTLYLNSIYQTIIGSSFHKLKAGASYMLDQYRESYNDSGFTRTESVPGIFTEYHYDLPQKFSLLGGLRLDYHNLYGVLVNPRLHLKIHLQPLTLFRLSAGRGLRVANVIAENQSVMASSRMVSVQPGLKPEVAWNYGITFTHKHMLFKKSATWNLDFFRTDFINQVVADLDQDVQRINFYNLDGASFSNAFQAEFSWEVKKRIDVRAAYKWQEAKTNYHGELLSRPFVSRHRVLLNMAYATKFEKWKFDLTPKWFGRSRIPLSLNHTTHEGMKSWSDPYVQVNAQLTRSFKRWDIYLGAENITGYMQHHQILAKDDPFGPFFDASLIWGPTMGRIFYAGLRLSIK